MNQDHVTDVTSHGDVTGLLPHLKESQEDRNPTVSEHTRYVLQQVEKVFGDYVAFPTEAARDAVVLWVAHTHVIPHLNTSPRLAILSSEPGSGKSRVLELLEALTPGPLMGVNVTPAVLWRTVDSAPIATLLLDEVDTLFGRTGSGTARTELRSILNSGNRRGATVPRIQGGHSGGVAHFNVFGPVAMAGLGTLPDTLMDRSIAIRMVKPPAKLRIKDFEFEDRQETAPIQWELEQWAKDAGKYIELADPELPVRNREKEVWKPLFAVAEIAGGEWPARVLKACKAFTSKKEGKEDPKTELLRAIKAIFAGQEKIFTSDLLQQLWDSDGKGGWEPETLSPRALARVLAGHDVHPKTVRIGEQTAKGYAAADLASAFAEV